MRELFVGRETTRHEDIVRLELQLHAAYRPVTPHPDFVKDLQRRMLEETRRQKPHVKINKGAWYQSILALAGVLSGTVLLVLGVRKIADLVGSKKALNQIKEALPINQTANLRPIT